VKNVKWWNPEAVEDSADSSAVLLSRRWVRTFAFELPALKRGELEATLRYKVRSALPVDIESCVIHTQVYRCSGKIVGIVFLAANEPALPPAGASRALRVGLPLFIPKGLGPRVLLFVSSPAGLEAQFYEQGILSTSFAPIAPDDAPLRLRILSQYPDAAIVGLAPDPAVPLPGDLAGAEPPSLVRRKLLESFPLWETRAPSRAPQLSTVLLMTAGLTLCAFALGNQLSAREKRNAGWKAWMAKAESIAAAPSAQEQRATWIKSQGVPVPELFSHLAAAWGTGTDITDLEWQDGKLVLTADSASALTSLRKLIADPWFHDIRVDTIQLQKDGREVFTVEGSLSIDK